MSEQKNKKPQLPSQMMLMIRAFLGAYVLYLAADIVKTENWADPNMLAVGGAALLVIGGVVVLFFTIRSFIRGEYEGGKADVGEEENVILSSEEKLINEQENVTKENE